MKKFILTTKIFLLSAGIVLAGYFDGNGYLVGFDGPCGVYFDRSYGYYEVCPDPRTPPIYLGSEFDEIIFHHNFRHNDFGFRHHHFRR